MKLSFYLILAISIGICLSACKQSTDFVKPAAAYINVTNAVAGGATLSLNIDAQTISNNSFAQYILLAGQSQVNLYVPAVAATATTIAVPAIPYYNKPLTTTNEAYYSLFLSGTSPAQVDATIVNETYTYAYADSVVGVRFINLSPNSNPISVDIKGGANGSEVATLAYKAYSGFKQYAAAKVNPSYAFEIRDATTGNLITSYTLSTTTPLFHNVTIALRGLVGGSPAPGTILVNDY